MYGAVDSCDLVPKEWCVVVEGVEVLVSRIESWMRQACLAGFEAVAASAVSAKQGVRARYAIYGPLLWSSRFFPFLSRI
jgi:hypothetical protein